MKWFDKIISFYSNVLFCSSFTAALLLRITTVCITAYARRILFNSLIIKWVYTKGSIQKLFRSCPLCFVYPFMNKPYSSSIRGIKMKMYVNCEPFWIFFLQRCSCTSPYCCSTSYYIMIHLGWRKIMKDIKRSNKYRLNRRIHSLSIYNHTTSS